MSTSEKQIVLKTSDGETFTVDEVVALQSQTIAHLIEDDCVQNEVPLANVTSEVLAKVLEYLKKHVGDDAESLSAEKKEELKKFDSEYVDIDQSAILDLILAANYLNIKNLLDLTCQTIADQIAACKTAVEIREKFHIENDFTPEEEDEIRKENQWAFE